MSGYQVSEDFLLDHAYRNVWCTPEQDKQAILQPAKITPENGIWTYFSYQWRKIQMPITGSNARFHIYQIGQVHPAIIGLLDKPGVWISAQDAMMQECAIIDIYTSKGVMIPRSLCWYIVTGDKNLLVAVRKPSERPKVVDVDLETDPIFVRIYENAYFQSVRAQIPNGCIKVNSIRADNVNAINAFQAEIAGLPTYGGVFFFVNGRRVDKIDLVSAQPGDYLEYVFDASVKREVVFKVRNLQEFESTLDGIHKYLLHYAGPNDMIDYQDDVDLYLGETWNTNRWHGVYLHKNDSRTMRMVTHRDYSVPVIRINGAQAANLFLAQADLELRLTVRHSGYQRPLVQENSRLFELYKLPDDRVLESMVGMDANVSVWKAAALEASAYTAIMRQPQGGVTRQMVQQAYGYNAMSKLLGDTPTKVTVFSGQKVIVIPPALRGCCTVYEYDANGRLLFYAPNTVDDTYTCQSADAAFAEIIFGLGGTSLDVTDNAATGPIDYLINYRFYTAPDNAGVKNGDWQDRTGDPVYLVQNNTYQWVVSAAPIHRVLSNKRHLAYSFQMAPIAGVFEFDITFYKDGTYQKLDMPLGELDIFFNGYSLIEGLDFVVKGSRVVVTTKKYFDPALAQQLFTVRYKGFCNKDMTRTAAPDVGFVFQGVLSANSRFDIRDDKVLRIVCGGEVRLREDLKFAEDGVSVNITDALNGAPYAIRDIVVPMNNYLVGNPSVADMTYDFRDASIAIDGEISDYMSRFLPQQQVGAPNAITNRYTVYSPFLSRIIDDLQTGVLWDDKFYEQFGDDWLRTRLAAYNKYLTFDPIQFGVDDRYVVVHPHPYPTYVTLDMYRWRVLQRAAAIYAPNVDLSSTVQVQKF
ncbi:putative virion structural protein [Ralstonia phage RP12]|uniref:Putative virion structural protein n=1 Tax=Ralstonia phage RP12 TaxID=1923889 RepID=A0A1L7N0L5_9CAUD|nr:putative virion structural protein [Ralstonia phage RP12]BAW19000.1 putative virion structural protein [Ralstonia phage RP12]